LILLVAWIELLVCWFGWAYPFLFRAPHKRKRKSITVAGPTRVGLVLEGAAIFMAFIFRLPLQHEPGLVRILASMVFGPIAAVLAWSSVKHLGKQFRFHAGLYDDHELVRTGAYAVVRHPIYASLLAILLSTLCLLTRWPWMLVSLVVFVAGTEIRVHSEERLLASRFGEEFAEYRKKVWAYVPFVR
jgi:protein-S-isoprenylcysteine O-methyltransferase Ste14